MQAQKKSPAPRKEKPSPTPNGVILAPQHDSGKRAKLSPRQARVIDALRPGGWVAREALDRIAGSSNSPDVVCKLRRKLGQDAIDMRTEDATDRDGRPCKPGSYRMTDKGRARLIELGLSASTEGRAAA